MTFSTEPEHIATLVHPDEYEKHLDQITGVYSDQLIFLKRKFMSMKGPELVAYPIASCSSITYKKKLAIVTMLLGVILIVGIPAIFLFGSVEPGTSIPIGMLALAMGMGYVMMRGPRRHRLTFVIDGKKYKWESKAGDFTYKQVSVYKVVSFARQRGILVDSDTPAVPA